MAAQEDRAKGTGFTIRPLVQHIDSHRFDLAGQAIRLGEQAGEELVHSLRQVPFSTLPGHQVDAPGETCPETNEGQDVPPVYTSLHDCFR